VAGAGWSEAGAPHGRERGGGSGPSCCLGRKGGGSAQQRLSPFLFFLNYFSPKSLNNTFEAFTKLFRGWSKKKNGSHEIPYNFALISEAKFQIEFES